MIKHLGVRLVEPVNGLVEAAAKFEKGDFDIGTPYESEDEFGAISKSFEHAAGTLKHEDLYTIKSIIYNSEIQGLPASPTAGRLSVLAVFL